MLCCHCHPDIWIVNLLPSYLATALLLCIDQSPGAAQREWLFPNTPLSTLKLEASWSLQLGRILTWLPDNLAIPPFGKLESPRSVYVLEVRVGRSWKKFGLSAQIADALGLMGPVFARCSWVIFVSLRGLCTPCGRKLR